MDHVLDLTAAVAAAVRAPSMHNSQPWRFRLREGGVELRADLSRRLPAADPTGWAVRLAGGAALLNLRLAIAGQGWEPVVRVLPDPADPALLAVVSGGRPHPVSPAEARLAAAIWTRYSHREAFFPELIPADARARLVAAANTEGGWLELLIGPGPASAVAQLAQAADRALMRRPSYRRELTLWSRASGRPSRDGVPVESAGPAPSPEDLLPARPFGDQPAGRGRDLGPYPVVAVLGTVDDTPGDQLVAGQVLQRVLLTATVDGLASAMVSQPIEVPGIREQLRLSLGRAGVPQMLLRVGYGRPGQPAGRRALAEVIEERTQVPPSQDQRPDPVVPGDPAAQVATEGLIETVTERP